MKSGGTKLVHTRELKVYERFSVLGQEGQTLAGMLPETPPDTVLVILDPDWQLPPASIGIFSREGKLKRGNTLLRCEPEELEPFLEWRRAQRDERHALAREARRLSNADAGLIVDPA